MPCLLFCPILLASSAAFLTFVGKEMGRCPRKEISGKENGESPLNKKSPETIFRFPGSCMRFMAYSAISLKPTRAL